MNTLTGFVKFIFVTLVLVRFPGIMTLSAQPAADFFSPDTVCVNTPVQLQNLTTGGSSFYWNFCSGNINNSPTGKNIGNPGNLLNVPTYSTLITDNNECFSFISNQMSQSVIRYDHGNSFANEPYNQVDLGTFGVFSDDVEGIQIKKEGNSWIGFVCNYDELVRLNFGTSLKNIPTATVIGPVSQLEMAHGFLLIQESGEWIGLISCTIGNRLVRLNFGSSLMNTPTFEILGTPGGLNAPGQMSHIIEGENNYVFVVNLNNSTLSRLNFGNSIKNIPSGVNLGDVCGSGAMGITLLRDCGSIHGFITRYLNASVSNDLLWRISFPDGLTGTIQSESLGNIGSLQRPCLFSELFRQNDTLFVYISNRDNGTRSLLSFASCNNATPPSSNQFNPPVFSYNQPGDYNVRLLVNEGLPDQASICKSIVVINKPEEKLVDTTLCFGDSLFAAGKWQTMTGIYHDTIPIVDGCDSLVITTLDFKPRILIEFGKDTILCNDIPVLLRTGVPDALYQWQDGSTDSTLLVTSPGLYWVIVTLDGCNARDSIIIKSCESPVWFPNAFTPNLDGINDIFHPIGEGVYKFSMVIFNRWGEQVFETSDFDQGWDGRFNGSDASDGVYYFVATFGMNDLPDETHHAHGSVTLLR